MAVEPRGFVTLTMALLLLSVLLLVSLSSARFKLLEQRVMANHLASQEAALTADAALAQVVMLVAAEQHQLNRSFSGSMAGGSYHAELVSEQVSESPRGAVDIISVQVTAQSADGRARRTVRQQLALMSMITAPLALLADHQTAAGLTVSDWLDWLFAIPASNWPQLHAMANDRFNNCDRLGPHSHGLIWVDGPCWLAPGRSIGSAEQPLLLIVQDADLTMAAATELFGLAVLFKSPGVVTDGRLQLSDSALIHGAVLADRSVVETKQPQLRHSADSLAALVRSEALKRVYRITGSWHDF